MDTIPLLPSATVEDAHSSTAAAAEDLGDVGEPPPAYSSAAAEIDGDVFGQMEEEEADEKRMSIAERRAVAGRGFCTPRTISTARFRWGAASPVTPPFVVTIPPGLSPTVLLDSPVMMHDSQMPPSPTTGTLPSLHHEFLIATGKEQEEEENEISYTFKDIHLDPVSMESPSNAENDQLQEGHPSSTSDHTTQFEELQDGVDAGLQHVCDEDEAVPVPATVVGRPSEDGYNWRKYGQKQVKGSEYPRSYYKCTQPSCLVKKKVERCYDGQITEIIYKGFHNHPKPLPNRRSMLGMAFPLSEASEDVSMAASSVKTEREPFWSSQQNSGSLKEDGVAGGLERTASASLITDMSYLLSGSSKTHLGIVNSAEAREFSQMPSSQGEDDVTTQSSMLTQENGNESDPKRRRLETCSFESSFATRNAREQKVVIETESEVDILDDGYRWRKYGQKVVKGNPNPRSYYKCTSPGCPVRKHVERASRDLRFVVTTYEGKHNHEVPTSRSNAQSCPGGGSNGNNGPNDVNATLNPHVSTSLTLPKHEPMRPDLLPVFMRSRGFTGDTFVGATPFYDMKLGPLGHPNLPHTVGLNSGHTNIPQVPSVCNVLPDYPRCFPVDLHGYPMVASCGFDSTRGGPTGLGNLSLVQQHPNATEARLLRPMKQEQDDGGVYTSCLPVNHHLANAPIAVYDQLPGGFEFN